MGEIAVKILNWMGVTGTVFAFIANLSNFLSLIIGMGSFVWLIFKVLKERENWLHRRAERKQIELEQMEREENYIRKIRV